MTKMGLYYYDMSIVYLPRLGTCYNRSMFFELDLSFVTRDDIRVNTLTDVAMVKEWPLFS